ncbi:hypothetical protein PR002_g21204 [Phytophthora rubi]|uniref:Uncharacterized protein n=1 Tax=Phytophthora rubi TaxID=129364 RepID=A0A6A3J7C5_9STRA|nr:hypothetical protein PR002_g21204 [Phytophthora rubi]
MCLNRLGRGIHEKALRTDGAKNEERVGFPGISKFTGLFSKAKPSPQNLELKDPTKVFNELRLGKAGLKLDDNPAVLEWLRYVDMYWAKNKYSRFIDADVYVMLLQSSKSEADVAKLFLSLRQNPDPSLAKLGLQLQETQFWSWMNKDFHPDSIPKLLGFRNGIPANDPRAAILEDYTVVYMLRLAKKVDEEATLADLAMLMRAN